MERNDGTTDSGTSAGQSDASGVFGSGATQPGAQPGDQPIGSGFQPADAASPADQPRSMRDRARGTMHSASERVSETGSALRERAGAAKSRLADVLESGAGRLRERTAATNEPTLAGVTEAGTTPIANDGKVTHVTERVAGGMQASAEWLRDADLDSLRADVEQQVREHPGRTLLIAAGLGYLIGRAFRGGQ